MAMKALPRKAGLSRRTKAALAVVGVLVLAGGAWGVAAARSRDKKVAVPKEFTVEALKAKATADDPGQVFQQIHQAMERKDLTEDQKHVIRENAHAAMEAERDKHIGEYFALQNETQRQAMLDQDIDRILTFHKAREQRRAEAGGGPGGMGGPGRGPNAGGGPPGAPPGGDHVHATPTRQQRKAFSESHNPDLHAREHAYHAALQKRAEQRGIQLPWGPGGR